MSIYEIWITHVSIAWFNYILGQIGACHLQRFACPMDSIPSKWLDKHTNLLFSYLTRIKFFVAINSKNSLLLFCQNLAINPLAKLCTFSLIFHFIRNSLHRISSNTWNKLKSCQHKLVCSRIFKASYVIYNNSGFKGHSIFRVFFLFLHKIARKHFKEARTHNL